MYYHKPIFDIRSDLQSRYEEVRYAMTMKQDVMSKSTITSGEVEYYFKRMPKDSIPIIPNSMFFHRLYVTHHRPKRLNSGHASVSWNFASVL